LINRFAPVNSADNVQGFHMNQVAARQAFHMRKRLKPVSTSGAAIEAMHYDAASVSEAFFAARDLSRAN